MVVAVVKVENEKKEKGSAYETHILRHQRKRYRCEETKNENKIK